MGAMRAAEERTLRFNAVPNDRDAAMLAFGRQSFYRAFEAIEHVFLAFPQDLHHLVVVVPTNLTFCHKMPFPYLQGRKSLTYTPRGRLERNGASAYSPLITRGLHAGSHGRTRPVRRDRLLQPLRARVARPRSVRRRLPVYQHDGPLCPELDPIRGSR